MIPSFYELANGLLTEMIRKSGTVAWEVDTETRRKMVTAAREMAAELLGIIPQGESMATSKILYTPMDGTPKQIVFADHAGDFSPTAANDLRITTDGTFELDVEFNPGALANAAYYQSAKFDFGALWALGYRSRLAVELAATPTAGNTISVWLAPSHSGTAGTGNAGGVSGAKSAYTGYSSNAAASVKQLVLASVFTVTTQATATVQVLEGWNVYPPSRYGSIVLLNSSGAAFHSDDAEFNLVFNPLVPQGQAS
jgi:hypothetical protein